MEYHWLNWILFFSSSFWPPSRSPYLPTMTVCHCLYRRPSANGNKKMRSHREKKNHNKNECNLQYKLLLTTACFFVLLLLLLLAQQKPIQNFTLIVSRYRVSCASWCSIRSRIDIGWGRKRHISLHQIRLFTCLTTGQKKLRL